MKRKNEVTRMEIRKTIWKILPEIQEYSSKRLMRFDAKKTASSGKQVYHRNDWTTYRVIEIDNFLANKFGI